MINGFCQQCLQPTLSALRVVKAKLTLCLRMQAATDNQQDVASVDTAAADQVMTEVDVPELTNNSTQGQPGDSSTPMDTEETAGLGS